MSGLDEIGKLQMELNEARWLLTHVQFSYSEQADSWYGRREKWLERNGRASGKAGYCGFPDEPLKSE